MSLAFFLLLSTATTITISSTAMADQWNKETAVTFTSPVEVPGKILPPGTYVFKLADSQSDRQLVQILTQDQRKVLASIQTIPDYHLHPAEKPLITLAERPTGRPEALQAWFYPGDNYGVQFVYPNSRVQPSTPVEPELASNTDPAATIPALIETVTPTEAEMIAPALPVMPVLAQPEQETQLLAENKVPQSEELLTLPKTASNILILPLAGVLLLGCGSMLCIVRQRV